MLTLKQPILKVFFKVFVYTQRTIPLHTGWICAVHSLYCSCTNTPTELRTLTENVINLIQLKGNEGVSKLTHRVGRRNKPESPGCCTVYHMASLSCLFALRSSTSLKNLTQSPTPTSEASVSYYMLAVVHLVAGQCTALGIHYSTILPSPVLTSNFL